MQLQANKQLEVSLDKNNYNDADLITLSVPLSLPYITDWNNFKRIDGEINYNGKLYHYVKERIYNNRLMIMCLPDQKKMNLQTAKNDYFKLSNDLQNNLSPKKQKGDNLLKQLAGEYDNYKFLATHFNYLSNNQPFSNNFIASLPKGAEPLPEKPPQA